MSVYYKLEPLDSASSAKMASNLSEVTAEEALCSAIPIVAAVTPSEFLDLKIENAASNENPWTLVDAESNYVEVYPDFYIGSFSVPDILNNSAPNYTFAFYLDKFKLIFVDQSDTAQSILKRMVSNGVIKDMTTSHCMYVFMKEMLRNDFSELGKFEDTMTCVEEEMMRHTSRTDTAQIMKFRRHSMRLGMFYQQIANMATEFADNENKMMKQREARAFNHIATLADRLTSRAEVLKEYAMQLHELQETHIDLKQNSIMQVFTIVTVLFAPLTLVTSWYGMNLNILPGTDWDFMWIALIVLALISTSVLLILFHRQRWL